MEIDEIPLNPRGFGRNLAARLRAVDLRPVARDTPIGVLECSGSYSSVMTSRQLCLPLWLWYRACVLSSMRSQFIVHSFNVYGVLFVLLTSAL